MNIYLKLFTSFFRMGLFTFGGGYAMLPLLQREVVETHHWATEEELLDYYAIGQTTPGIIAVNTATFIGQRQKGILGAIVAVLGLLTPSVLIISLLSGVLEHMQEYALVHSALVGIRIAVSALIFRTVIQMGRSGIKEIRALLIFIMALVLMQVFQTSVMFTVLFGAVLGVLFQWRRHDTV